jgi:acyl-CoA synthetase (AMP-forming)/AMP-acid ligase II
MAGGVPEPPVRSPAAGSSPPAAPPLAAGDFARFEELTGHRILERYGMSETLFTLSNPYEDRRPGTVGLPIPGCEVRIVDEAGAAPRPASPGDPSSRATA